MENDVRRLLWKLADTYRSILLSERMMTAVIRMIFVKFATDNYLYAETKDEMRHYANVQKAIANRDVTAFTESLIPVLELIDNSVHAHGILSRVYSLVSDDLMSATNKKRNYTSDQAKQILEILSSIDLEIETTEKDDLVDSLKEFIYTAASYSGRLGGENSTTQPLNNLACALLNVDENDSYMDFACGYGLSAMEVTKGNVNEMLLSDVNEEAVQIAYMMNIMAGKDFEKIDITVKNIFDCGESNRPVSKMFVDFPFGIRVDRNEYGYSDGTVLAIHRAIDNLKENGMAVITCHSNLLFRNNKEVADLRDYLLSNKYLQAVITLPPVMIGASINVNLLLLSKQNNKEIVFIDASKNDFVKFSVNAKVTKAILTEEGIKRITSIVYDKESIPGVSEVVNPEMVFKKETLVPAAYIVTPEDKDQMSLEKINMELQELYKQLRELNS